MMRINEIFIWTMMAVVMLGSSFVTPVTACTGIRLQSTDEGVVAGRTMEWGSFDLRSRINIIPRGKEFVGLTPDGYTGKKWKGKYGVVGLDLLEKVTIADGMNEKGLYAGLFYHPGFAEYPKYDPKKSDISITAIDVVHYILTQFATIDEVREGMSQVRVIPVVEESIGMPVYAHFMVTDPQGRSIVIEFANGKMKIFESPLGVITNAPNYDWHMTNLRNYVNLSTVAIPARKIEELNFTALGAGSGMIGLPGDFTPPSRFVRAVAFTQTARETKTTDETIYELFRILDNFQLGDEAGEGADISHDENEIKRSSTLWTTAFDTKKRVFYYHTQHNRRVRKIDLSAINFSALGDAIVYMPLDKQKEQDIEDITPE